MKKIIINLLSGLIIPTVPLVSLVSCGNQPEPKPTPVETYNISGGSTTLRGQASESGSDTASWVVKNSKGEPVTATLSLKGEDPTTVPVWIKISDGKVNWTNAATVGTYTFKVQADIAGTDHVFTNVITLTIEPAETYSITGGSLTLRGKIGKGGSDTAVWAVKNSKGESVAATLSIAGAGSDFPTWIKINKGTVNWTESSVEGTYTFAVKAEIQGRTNPVYSDQITLTIDETYILTGGSTTLTGAAGTASSDTSAWIVKNSKGDTVTATLSLKPEDPSTLPDWIQISNGKVTWADAATVGTYTFKVQADIAGTDPVYSDPITLNILKAYTVTGGSTTLTGKAGIASSDTNVWKVINYKGESITAILSLKGEDPTTVPDWIQIMDGKIYWTNAAAAGTYTFKVQAIIQGQVDPVYSDTITFWIDETYTVTGGSTKLSGMMWESGSDSHTWMVQNSKGESVRANWSIEGEGSGFPNWIQLNDRKVIWTDGAVKGKYIFKLKIEIPGHKEYVYSDPITLTIYDNHTVTGGSTSLYAQAGINASDTGTWALKNSKGDVLPAIWSLEGDDPTTVPDWLKVDGGKVNWTNSAVKGKYTFKVKAKILESTNTVYFYSDLITLNIGESKVESVRFGHIFVDLEFDTDYHGYAIKQYCGYVKDEKWEQGQLQIPPTYDNIPIVGIKSHAFDVDEAGKVHPSLIEHLSSVDFRIATNLKYIGSAAFWGVRMSASLFPERNLDFSNTKLETLGKDAFSNSMKFDVGSDHTNFHKLILPHTIRNLGEYAFAHKYRYNESPYVRQIWFTKITEDEVRQIKMAENGWTPDFAKTGLTDPKGIYVPPKTIVMFKGIEIYKGGNDDWTANDIKTGIVFQK